jgi:hypothetical protein
MGVNELNSMNGDEALPTKPYGASKEGNLNDDIPLTDLEHLWRSIGTLGFGSEAIVAPAQEDTNQKSGGNSE